MAYRPTARTEAHRQRQQNAILRAGILLINKGGFAAVTIQAVAQRAAVATGSIYRYFPSKADLCAALFREATQREIDRVSLQATQPGPASERLAGIIRSFCHRALRGRLQAYALIAEPVDPAVEAERLTYRQAYANVFRQLVDDGITLGEFVPQDSTLTAAALVGTLAETLVGPLSQHLHNGLDVDAEEESRLIRHVTAFCMRAVTGKEFS